MAKAKRVYSAGDRYGTVEETIDDYHIFVRKIGGARACTFSIVRDTPARWMMSGSEPGPCRNALTAARKIVTERRAKGLGRRKRRRFGT